MKKEILPITCRLFYFVGLIGILLWPLVSRAGSSGASGQNIPNVKDVRITLSLENASLVEVFKAIETRTSYRFSYDASILDKNKRITLIGVDRSVADFLVDVSRQTKLKFKQVNRRIAVTRVSKKAVFKQTRDPITVTGQVSSLTDDETLPGVNVVEKGTTNGTITDVDGNYSIEVAGPEAIIVFSSVGFISEEVVVGNQTVVDMVLFPDIKSLEEIVVIGYGEVERRDLTGSVGSLDAQEINELPVAGFDEAMQGKLAGVQVKNSNAAPGGGFDIFVRGVGSLNSGSFPLVVIDGMPIQNETFQEDNNPFNLLNPNDIASIEVLKDASAAAIYGSRAANGVILVTTKRGKQGKSVINFNASYGVSEIINQPEFGSRDQWAQFYRDSRLNSYTRFDPGAYNPVLEETWDVNDDLPTRNGNLSGENTGGRIFRNIQGGLAFLAYDDTNISGITQSDIDFVAGIANGTDPIFNNNEDWISRVQRDRSFPGRQANYNLSASGGSENIKYLLSGSYFDQEGIVRNTGFERFTLNINLDFDVNDNIRLGTKIAPTYQVLNNLNGQNVTQGRWFVSPLWQTSLLMPPILNAYDADGNIIHYGADSDFRINQYEYGITFFGNPLYWFEETDERETFRSLANVWGEVSFLKDFTFRSAIQTDFSASRRNQFRPSTWGFRFGAPGPQNFANGTVNGTSTRDQGTKWYWENLLTYKKTVADNHNITATAGYTAEKTVFSDIRIRKEGFLSDDVELISAANIVEDQLNDATESALETTFVGMFGRVIYDWNNRYYLTASFRRDGSSRFGSETLWGNFPSVAVAWRLSDEPFMSNFGFLDNLKFRGSYGVTGNSAIPNFRQQRIIGLNNYIINNASALTFEDAELFDPRLGWERTEEFNAGVDIGFFNGRLNATVDVYQRITTDMLLNVQLPDYTGYSSILQNFGEMENRGVEVTINATPVTGPVLWNTSVNVSHNRNFATRLFDNENEFIQGFNASGFSLTRTYVDGPVSVFWGGIFDGAFNDWDEVYNEPSVFNYFGGSTFNMRNRNTHPGDLKTLDVDGDGVLTNNDRTVIGNPWPDFNWGFTNTLRWKNIDLFVQIDGIVGAEVYNVVRFENYRQGQRGFNMPAEYLNDYWAPDNPDARFPILRTNRQVNSGWDNSLLVEDGDYTALRTLRLGYTLPEAWTDRNFIDKMRLYVNVQNALYFTEYSGYNPEGNNRGDEASGRARNFGVDGGNYPLSRVITFGVDLTL
ncbi:MAG: TonB-dependent receptor [Bacteroidota bacterium]